MFGNCFSDKVVWDEIDETKLSPEEIEERKHNYLNFACMAGYITYEKAISILKMNKSFDEIQEIVENERSIMFGEKAVWSLDK